MNSHPMANATEDRERVYDFPGCCIQAAEDVSYNLRRAGLNATWDRCAHDGQFRCRVSLPAAEVPLLDALQQKHPGRFGYSQKAQLALGVSRDVMDEAAKRDNARRAALSRDQNRWISALNYHGDLSVMESLDLNERLDELSAQHFTLMFCRERDGGLSGSQERAVEVIEGQVLDVLSCAPGITGARFSDNPRFVTVGVVFESGVRNSVGCFKAPLNHDRVDVLLREAPEFWEAVADTSTHTNKP